MTDSDGVATDVTEDRLRTLVLPHGWVDVKVCAVDATWSGLRFVWRLTHPVAPESSLPPWQRLSSEIVHWLLYALVRTSMTPPAL